MDAKNIAKSSPWKFWCGGDFRGLSLRQLLKFGQEPRVLRTSIGTREVPGTLSCFHGRFFEAKSTKNGWVRRPSRLPGPSSFFFRSCWCWAHRGHSGEGIVPLFTLLQSLQSLLARFTHPPNPPVVRFAHKQWNSKRSCKLEAAFRHPLIPPPRPKH